MQQTFTVISVIFRNEPVRLPKGHASAPPPEGQSQAIECFLEGMRMLVHMI
jgi:hypothetical protein